MSHQSYKMVKTAPCPRCGSFRTEAAISHEGECFCRACLSCTWMWDFDDGRPPNFAELAKPISDAAVTK